MGVSTVRATFLRLFLVAASALAVGPAALAQIQWSGAGDGSTWNDPANWIGGAVPTPTDSASITGATVTLSTNVTVASLTMIDSTIQGAGNLTVTSLLDARDGTITGVGRVIVPAGAAATLNPATSLSILRRFDVAGTVNCSGPLITFSFATTYVSVGGNWSSNAQTLVFTNNAVLDNSGAAAIHAATLTLTDGGRIQCSGALTLDGLAPGTPMVVNGNTGSGPPATIASNGPITVGDRGAGINMFITGQRGEFVGTVNVLGGVLTVNHKTRFFKTVTVATGASLTLNPLFELPNAISLEGLPAVQGTGEVVLNQGIYSIPFSMAGSNSMRFNFAAVTLSADQTFSAPVSLTTSYLRGPANLTFTARLDLNNGQLQGPGNSTFAPSCQVFANLGPNGNNSGGTLSGQCTNLGTMTIAGGLAGTSGSLLTNAGTITLTGGTLGIRTQNAATGVVNVVAVGSSPLIWGSLAENVGAIRLQSGTLQLGFSSNDGLPAPTNVGTIQIDPGAALRLVVGLQSSPGSVIANQGSIDFAAGQHDPATMFIGDGTYSIREPATLTLRQPVTRPPTGSMDGTLNLVSDQTWDTLRLNGHLSGPGNLQISQSLNVNGYLDLGGNLEILPGATMVAAPQGALNGGLQISRRVINRGTATITANNLAFSSGILDNRGQLTLNMGPNIGAFGTGNQLINSGVLSCISFTGPELEFPGPNPSNPGRVPLQFVNSGTLNISGALKISGGGSTSTPIAVTATNRLNFGGGTFLFTAPVAITGAGNLRLDDGVYDFTTSRLDCTGMIGLRATVTLAHPVTPSSIEYLGGTVTLLSDQVWPRFALTGVVQGPGNLTMTPMGNGGTNWSGGRLAGPGTVTIASGATVTIASGSPTVLATTLNNNGILAVLGRLQIDGGTLNNPGQLTMTGGFLEGIGTGGSVNSSGIILNNLGNSTFLSTASSPLGLLNSGLVRVIAGSLTIQNPLNYSESSHSIAGGSWTIESTGVLTLPGADIRAIGPGTTVSLLSTSSASFPALANLTSNAGTLILGSGRTQNINPIGGTFTNSGELSLRAGSLFNVVGNFIQTAIGTLRTQIAGPSASQIGRLAAAGSVTLGGTVIAEYANGYTPASCNATLPFISASSVTGTFANAATAPINGRVSRVVVGASIAALSVRNPADVATIGGLPPGDNALTADDVIVYLNAFFSNNLAVADVAALGSALTPDGAMTPDDLIGFLNSFFAGCN
ncbi:MAG: GC-type dockerin domain-anchored protein [Phycisphaerales bacterium]